MGEDSAQPACYAAISLDSSRRIGCYDRGQPGPLLVVTAGIHGNEPAGVHALRRVFAELERDQPPIAGRIVGLLGNRAALARGVRFVEEDLNRMWSPEALRQLSAQRAVPAPEQHHEQREQRELFDAIEAEIAGARGAVMLLDLHSTSGDGPPFLVLDEEERNHALAARVGVPAILGLLREVEGTILDFAALRGISCVVLEGGQNQAPTTLAHHEDAVWIVLGAAGLLAEGERQRRARAHLAQRVGNLPGAVEIQMRYAIEPGEQFTMLPGFKSFQPVEKGELLALGGASGQREIRCPIRAILLMPRYQNQGLDGFFLAQRTELVA